MSEALLHAQWPVPPSVRALTTLRYGAGGSVAPFDSFNMGTRCGDETSAVERNRATLSELAKLPSVPCWLRQVHGTRAERFALAPAKAGGGWEGVAWDQTQLNTSAAFRTDSSDPTSPLPSPSGPPAQPSGALRPASQWLASGPHRPLPSQGRELEADASVTSAPNTVLAILTADCLPVLFAAKDGSEVAAAHAGWRGLAAGVLETTVAAMQTPRENLLAWLGPAAGPQQYEIGVEVYDAFVAQDWKAGDAFVSTRPDHWRVDLYALARRRLQQAGLKPENIHGGDLCTISDPQRFYSHRRDQRTGRMASLIWIES